MLRWRDVRLLVAEVKPHNDDLSEKMVIGESPITKLNIDDLNYTNISLI